MKAEGETALKDELRKPVCDFMSVFLFYNMMGTKI